MDAVLGIGLAAKPIKGSRIRKRIFGARPYYVYILLCPDTGEARYVGSCQDPKQRKRQHSRAYANPTQPVQKWVTELVLAGKKPAFHIVAVVYGRHLEIGDTYLINACNAATSVEALLIHQIRRSDNTLLNVTAPRLFKMEK